MNYTNNLSFRRHHHLHKDIIIKVFLGKRITQIILLKFLPGMRCPLWEFSLNNKKKKLQKYKSQIKKFLYFIVLVSMTTRTIYLKM